MLTYYKKLVEHKEQDVANLEKALHAHASEQQKLQVALQAAINAQQAATMSAAHKERQLAAEVAARRADADAAATHAAKVRRVAFAHAVHSHHSWNKPCMRRNAPRRSCSPMPRKWRPCSARANRTARPCRTSTWHWASAWNR